MFELGGVPDTVHTDDRDCEDPGLLWGQFLFAHSSGELKCTRRSLLQIRHALVDHYMRRTIQLTTLHFDAKSD